MTHFWDPNGLPFFKKMVSDYLFHLLCTLKPSNQKLPNLLCLRFCSRVQAIWVSFRSLLRKTQKKDEKKTKESDKNQSNTSSKQPVKFPNKIKLNCAWKLFEADYPFSKSFFGPWLPYFVHYKKFLLDEYFDFSKIDNARPD